MRRLRTAVLSLVATFVVAVGAGAQPAKTNMQFLGLGSPSVTVGNVTGGIYKAKWDGLVDPNPNVFVGTSTIDIVCLDLLNTVSSTPYTANIVNLGNFNATDRNYLRFGGYSGAGDDWLTRYRAVAYLSFQMKNAGPSNTTLLQEYHTAIWRTMTEKLVYNVPIQSNTVYSGTDNDYTGSTVYGTSSNATPVGTIASGAVALMLSAKNYALSNASNTAFWSQFTVLSDVAMVRPAVQSGSWSPLTRGNQEFITFTATPEPASLALMGTGLLAVGFVGRRRKHSGSTEVAKVKE